MFEDGGAGYNVGMWLTMLLSHSTRSFLTACPMGHERSLTVDASTPEQDWVLTCPICGDEHQLRAPQIIASDL